MSFILTIFYSKDAILFVKSKECNTFVFNNDILEVDEGVVQYFT